MDKNRRKFLKIMFIGGATLLFGRVLSPLFSGLFNDSLSGFNKNNFKNGPQNKTGLVSFRVFEDKEILSIYDSSGEEVFQIDKKG